MQNRPGNVDDAKGARRFLREPLAQVRATLAALYRLEFRMDGAFFRRDILALLERAGAEYAIKVPLSPMVGAEGAGARDAEVDPRGRRGELRRAPRRRGWQRRCRIVLYRRHVWHETAKNFQLDLVDRNDGHYEYRAVVTNKALAGPALWAFMCGRGAHEKVYGELKTGFAGPMVGIWRSRAGLQLPITDEYVTEGIVVVRDQIEGRGIEADKATISRDRSPDA